MNPLVAHFFPASSRLDTERRSVSNRHRRASRNSSSQSGQRTRPTASDPPFYPPSHVNWIPPSPVSPSPSTFASVRPSAPVITPTLSTPAPALSTSRRLSRTRLSRSASLSALGDDQSMYKHPTITSNRSLQLDMSAVGSSATDRPAPLYVNPLSPIYEVHSPSSSRRPQSDIEPPTPASVGSNYSAFLKRPLRRSVSQASASSSLHTSASNTPPVLPPINLSPVELRAPFIGAPRSASQPISTVYEDGNSERTASFVTAHTSDDEPPTATARIPREQELDTDPEATLATTTGSRDSFIWRRWRRGLSFGSRPSFLLSLHLPKPSPPRAAILFWVGFIAPWCWLVGGWLVEEGRWAGVREREKNDGPVLPVWRVPAADGAQDGAALAPRRQSSRWTQWLAVGGGGASGGEKDFELVSRRGEQAWVVRCRIAAVISGALLVAGFVVALVLASHLH